MNVVKWNPMRDFDRLFQVMERPVNPTSSVRRSGWLPLVDIRETKDSYQIEVEVPAVASEDLSVSFDNGVLSVSGERKSATDEAQEDGRVHRLERRYGKFERQFRMPEDVDAEAIKAQARDGVLYLTVGKQASATPRSIEVQVA
ncbi:MAG: Hsp20/alpha crystallin family protein [Pseudomonadota bacterium]